MSAPMSGPLVQVVAMAERQINRFCMKPHGQTSWARGTGEMVTGYGGSGCPTCTVVALEKLARGAYRLGLRDGARA